MITQEDGTKTYGVMVSISFILEEMKWMIQLQNKPGFLEKKSRKGLEIGNNRHKVDTTELIMKRNNK